MENILKPVLPTSWLDECPTDNIHINPTGNFVIGGPVGDCGLTGRKIIVDTYGGMARHGGGAFSGKDPSKVDRSAAYATRWVAKNIVAAGLASKRCELQVAYAIGVAEPDVHLPRDLRHRATSTTDASRRSSPPSTRSSTSAPTAIIIEDLQLRSARSTDETAAYGHFGREGARLHLGEAPTAPTPFVRPPASPERRRDRRHRLLGDPIRSRARTRSESPRLSRHASRRYRPADARPRQQRDTT